MRTKTLMLSAVLGFSFVGASMAQQVFSVNAVGFVNRSAPPGFSIITNPLNNGDNSLATLFPTVPSGTQIFKYSAAGGYTTYSFIVRNGQGQWSDPTAKIDPGTGVFIKNTTQGAIPLTFVGEVPQGNATQLNVHLDVGYTLVGSKVPQSLVLKSPDGSQADLNFPATGGDQIYFYRSGAYQSFSYVTRNGVSAWSPSDPKPEVGEGFFVKKAAATDWGRDFSVNQ